MHDTLTPPLRGTALPPQGDTARLARWAANLRYEDIPEDVLSRVKITLLDTLGVSIAALDSPDAAALLSFVQAFPSGDACTLPGSGERCGPLPAALVWSTLSDVYEIQDGWRFGGIHACLVIGAALAVAEWKGATGRDLLTAIVVGYEVAHRVAWAVHPEHMGRGHMPNGTAGTVGSAAAAAWLLGLEEQSFAGALGAAGFLLPYATAETLWAGYSAKPLHTGWAARTGIEAALMAERGFYGCPLEGSETKGRGWLELAASAPRVDRLCEGLGTLWTIRDTYFKFYPICRQAQSAAEAALTLAREERLDPTAISRVTVKTWALSAEMLGRPIEPGAGRVAAQFSLPWIIAVTLTDAAIGTAQLSPERLNDTTVHALAKRVEVIVDPELDALYPGQTIARVSVEMADGTALVREVDMAKGDPRIGTSDAELLEKFEDLTAGVLPAEMQAKIKNIILSIETSKSLSPIMSVVPLALPL